MHDPKNASGETPTATETAATFSRENIALNGPDGAASTRISVLRFGTPGARPKAYLQAGLHADELPGMLVLRALVKRLEETCARGEILGEIVVVPMANPIGLAQRHFGILQGRFDEASGENFNRAYPDVTDAVAKAVSGALGADSEENTAIIRAAIAKTIAQIKAEQPVQQLRKTLFQLAYDADVVLDLHADNEALVHLYTGPAHWPDAEDLAAELDARAVLLCEKSGGHPFDEACSAPWWELAASFPDHPIPPACLAATLELRSNNAVEAGHIESDSAALFRFLQRRGLVAGDPGAVPRLLCQATHLKAMQQIKAPCEGILVYHARLGDTVRKGDLIATITDPLGDSTDICAETDGVLFARHDQRYAWPDKVVGKIAGSEILPGRDGNLLSQ